MKTTQKNKKRTTKQTLKGGSYISTKFKYTDETYPQNNIEIDLKPLLERFDVFAWDFDETIATINANISNKSHTQNSQVPKSILKKEPVCEKDLSLKGRKLGRLTLTQLNTISDETLFNCYFFEANKFIELYRFLKKHKKTVAIISFGFRSSVEAALTKIFRHYYKKMGSQTKEKVLPFYIDELKPFSGPENTRKNYMDVFEVDELSNTSNTSTTSNTSNSISVDDILLLHSKYKGPTIYGPDKETPHGETPNPNNNTDYRNIYKLKKVNYMNTLCKNFNVPHNRVLFFDDDYTNNIKLSQLGVNAVTAVTVPGEKGRKKNLKSTYKDGFSLDLLKLLNDKIETLPIPAPHDFIFKFDISSSNTN
jgi:hypothetical protein